MSRKRKAPYVDFQLDDLINSNGGFFIEPTRFGGAFDAGKDAKGKKPLINYAQEEQECAEIACSECQKLGVEPNYRRWFNIHVCKECRTRSERYKFVTKTEAQDDYILTDSELRVLPFVERPNPRNARYHDMKLYLRRQVEDFSFKKWGGEDKLDAEHVRRETEREAKKAKKFQKHLEELREKAKRTPLDDVTHVHSHTFGEEVYDPASGKWSRKCSGCTHTESYEKL